jgi:hypothetical protein
MHEYELLLLEGPKRTHVGYHTVYSVIIAKCHVWWKRRSFSGTIDVPCGTTRAKCSYRYSFYSEQYMRQLHTVVFSMKDGYSPTATIVDLCSHANSD